MFTEDDAIFGAPSVQRAAREELKNRDMVETSVTNLVADAERRLVAEFLQHSFSTIVTTMKASGLEKPIFNTDFFSYRLAPMTGANPGAVYVSKEKTYIGKIVSVGADYLFKPVSPFPGNLSIVLEQLVKDDENFQASVIAYGKRTGRCGVCHRPLTNPASIAAGIGPICAGYFGGSFTATEVSSDESLDAETVTHGIIDSRRVFLNGKLSAEVCELEWRTDGKFETRRVLSTGETLLHVFADYDSALKNHSENINDVKAGMKNGY